MSQWRLDLRCWWAILCGDHRWTRSLDWWDALLVAPDPPPAPGPSWYDLHNAEFPRGAAP